MGRRKFFLKYDKAHTIEFGKLANSIYVKHNPGMSLYRQKQRILPAGYACVRLDEINIITSFAAIANRLANPANSDLSRGFSDVHRREFQGG